ncbi:MAG: hypothetical protein L3J39_06710 [Verrucomicrobiales bacterium]|nr:hypothetical protein [Verrucomicrobiales bacterium]
MIRDLILPMLVAGILFLPWGSFVVAKVVEYPGSGDYVVLLHGVWGSERTMVVAAEVLQKKHFYAIVISYPSTKLDIEEITAQVVQPAIKAHCKDRRKKIHFVGHSLGGLLIRKLLSQERISRRGRVVMIATPNQGNKFASAFGGFYPVEMIFGPTLKNLKTGKGMMRKKLGSVDFELGVIMGRLPRIAGMDIKALKEHDGLVLAESGKVTGMHDYIVVKGRHASLAGSRVVMRQMCYFLQRGKFERGFSTKERSARTQSQLEREISTLLRKPFRALR